MGQNNNRLLYLTEREGRTGEYWPEVVVVRIEGCYLRWPKTVTSKRNAQQIQIAHSKFKSPTANSNCSQQITNLSQQIQIAHSQFKLLTAN